jgi:hypothetical protein
MDHHPAIGANRQVERHLDAAQRAPQHHPFAVKLDHPDAFVGREVARFEA